MAALGDSFTSALFSGAPCSASGRCPANSWSTGTNPAIELQPVLTVAPTPRCAKR